MSHLSNKAKHYGLIALKVFILAATFWFIYDRLQNTDERTINSFFDHLTKANPTYLLLFILLTAANWSLEIKKWQLLVNTLHRISFRESLRQCLASLSVSMSTPNRIGEYGAKALFFSQEKRKKVMVLNLVSNTSQMLITIFFGIPGLLYFLFRNDIAVALWKLVLIFILVILLIVAGYYLRKTKLLIKGLTLEKVFHYVQTISLAVRWKVVLYSALRYIIFSGLFYLLLTLFWCFCFVTRSCSTNYRHVSYRICVTYFFLSGCSHKRRCGHLDIFICRNS